MDGETKVKIFSAIGIFALIIGVIANTIYGFSDSTIFVDEKNESNKITVEKSVTQHNPKENNDENDESNEKTFYTKPEDNNEDEEIENDSYTESISEDEYNSKMSDIMFMLSQSAMDFTLLMDEVILDHYMLEDEMWNMELEFTLLDIKDMIKEVRAIDVPTRYKVEHDLILNGVEQFEIAFDSYSNAMESLSYSDVEKMNIASEKGANYMNEAADLIEKR